MPSFIENRGQAQPHAWWVPALGLALLLGELCLLGLSLFHPRVDRYYQSYYIAGARPCWLPEPQAAAALADLRVTDIKVASLGPDDACFLLDGGWSTMENWGVWSNGPAATLELPTLAGRRHQLDIKLIAFSPHNRQSVVITLNGVPAGSYFVSSRSATTLALTVPPNQAGDLRILFRIRHPASPSLFKTGSDHRQLGIGLIALHWK